MTTGDGGSADDQNLQNRIVQEALTNTLKHAGASNAAVTVRYGASEPAVDVLDDRRGRAANGAAAADAG